MPDISLLESNLTDIPTMAPMEFPMLVTPMQLAIGQLWLDPSYQRPRQDNVELLVKFFEPLAFQRILVALRRTGGGIRYYIVDGQQRTYAARDKGYINLPADVFESTGPKMEAAIFKWVNTLRKKMSPLDLFKAALRAGDQSAKEIEAVLKKQGLVVPKSKPKEVKWPQVGCVQILCRVHTQGKKELLEKVFETLTSIWPKSNDILREAMIAGMAILLHKNHTGVDFDRLHKALVRVHPHTLLQAANDWLVRRKKGTFKRYDAVERELAIYYNKNLPEHKRLPEWS